MSKLKEYFASCPTPQEELTKEDGDLLISLRRNQDIAEPITYAEFLAHPNNPPKDEIPPALMLLWGRSLRLGEYFRMSMSAVIFLSLFLRRPVDAALYFGYVAYRAKEKGIRDITLEFLSIEAFPMGMFHEDQLRQMWEAQKQEGSIENMLDDGEQWRVYLYGDQAEGKIIVRYSQEDERPMTLEEVLADGAIVEPNVIDGHMFFWLKGSYVSVSMEDFEKISAAQ